LEFSQNFYSLILIIVLYDSTKIHGYLLSAQSRAGNLIKPLPPPYKNNFNLIAEHCLKSHTNLSWYFKKANKKKIFKSIKQKTNFGTKNIGKGKKLDRLQFGEEGGFLDENWTVDATMHL
jgi:hypothetical protein